MKLTALVVIASLIASSYFYVASAKPAPVVEHIELRRVAQDLVEKMSSEKYEATIDLLNTFNKNEQAEHFRKQMESHTHERKRFLAKHGKAESVEFIRKDVLGNAAVRFVFAERYAKTMALEYVIFVRGRDSWFCSGIGAEPNLASTFGLTSADSPSEAEQDTLQHTATDFAALIRAGKSDQAIALVKELNKLDLGGEIDHKGYIFAAENQYKAIAGDSGGPIAIELLRKENIGRSLIQFVFIERYTNRIALVRVGFYRTSSGWILHLFGWENNLLQLFDRRLVTSS